MKENGLGMLVYNVPISFELTIMQQTLRKSTLDYKHIYRSGPVSTLFKYHVRCLRVSILHSVWVRTAIHKLIVASADVIASYVVVWCFTVPHMPHACRTLVRGNICEVANSITSDIFPSIRRHTGIVMLPSQRSEQPNSQKGQWKRQQSRSLGIKQNQVKTAAMRNKVTQKSTQLKNRKWT